MARILYQGHASFRITSCNGSVIYIDPYAGDGYEVSADIVLITHQHPDHSMIELINAKENCRIIKSIDSIVDGVYQKYKIQDVIIEAVPAYNDNHLKSESVGYIVSVDGVNCYFAGDTSKIKEMEYLSQRNIEYAFLPIDGIYNMNAAEASECAKIIGAKYSVPIHTDLYSLFDENKANEFYIDGKMTMTPGNEIELK